MFTRSMMPGMLTMNRTILIQHRTMPETGVTTVMDPAVTVMVPAVTAMEIMAVTLPPHTTVTTSRRDAP